MGVLGHCLRTLDRSLVPPSAWAEIFWRTCLKSHLQTSPPTLRSHIWSFGPLGQILKFKKKKLKRGGLRIFLGVNISSFFGENKAPVKFQNSNWLPSKIFKKLPPGGQGVGVQIFFFFHNFYYFFLGAMHFFFFFSKNFGKKPNKT